jgi:signal peptidase II
LSNRERYLPFGLAAVVFVLDFATKALIRSFVSAWDTYSVIPGFFNIIHTENPGGAFSMFANADPDWRAFFFVGVSTAALVLIAFLLWRPNGRLGDSLKLRYGLALIMGGSLGNLYDRLVRGAVTDFLEFYVGAYRWPAFNVADMALTVGAALVLLDMLCARRSAVTTT